MKKSLIKIISLLIIVGLNWTGLSAVIETVAYYNDTETSLENTFSAGTLDFSLRSGQGNFISPAENMKPGDSTARDIYINKTPGSLPFKYTAVSEPVDGSCDLELYNALHLEVWYNYYHTQEPVDPNYHQYRTMDLKYDGLLKDFDLRAMNVNDPDLQIPNSHEYFENVFYGEDEHWFYYSIILPSGIADNFQGEVCDFNFVFNAWQDNLTYLSGGFTDTEKLGSIIKAGYWNPPVVLNEFLPRPNGIQYGHDFGTDSSDMPKGEWVELYNNSNTARDLSGWYVRDSLDISDHKILIDTAHTGLTTQIIGAKGFLVVFMNKALFNNDSDDSVRLFDTNDVLIDSYSYTLPADFCNLKPTEGDNNDENGSGIGTGCRSEVPTNKSYARIPDGIGAWVDPIPTPGAPNKLSEEEKMELGLLPLEEQIATTTTTTISDSDNLENSTTTSTTIPDQTTISTTTVDFISSPSTSTTTIIETLVEESAATTTTTEPPMDEATTIEEVPIIEEQPVAAPDNSSEEQTPPAETNSSGGDSGGGDGTTDNITTTEGVTE